MAERIGSVGLVSLGCAKNQVDGEAMLARLEQAGWQVKDDAALCDVAIVNTCGFIQSAKQESIDEILELARLKQEGRIKAIVVTGCLAERYQAEVMRELPECDAVCGIGANADIDLLCRAALAGAKPQSFPDKSQLPLCGARRLLTPSYFAYLKIAEGCSRRCAYCAIPHIRGPYRSRPLADVLAEARELVQGGAKELNLIAQETTEYGRDLPGGKLLLPALLRELGKLAGLEWIRILYAYPDTVTPQLLQAMAEEPKVLPYIDLPLQHCSAHILRDMRRGGDAGSLRELIGRIRAAIPDVTLRTTFLVGFPGETEADFDELCAFAAEMRFDRMGCFAYSQEEGTAAAALPDQVPEQVKQRRAELLMEQQMERSQRAGEAMVGSRVTLLCEGWDRFASCWFGRMPSQAPDDIDGKVYFTVPQGAAKPHMGAFVQVDVTDCMDGDLIGALHSGEGAE